MLYPVGRVYNNLNYLLYTPPEPTIGTQPSLWLPKCLNLGVEEEFERECKTILSEKDLHLQFSIDFHHSSDNDLNDIVDNFEFEKTKIVLERFIRKSSSVENYDAEKHRPAAIYLPQKDEVLHGFSLFISDSPCASNNGNIKKGFQIVSLHTSLKQTIETTDERALIISLFKNIMGIGNDIDYTKIAYRFSIYLKRRNLPNMGKSHLPILTDMFKLKFSIHEYMVILERVEPKDYHMGQ